jgi:DNA-binding response OmpR family regulator
MSSCCVLIVDDNVRNAQYLARLLRSEGVAADTVASEHDLFEYLRDHRPDLILLDIMLPETSGLELLPRLTGRLGDDDGFQVVMFSALSNEELVRTALDRGAKDYLVKGATGWPELYRRIRAQLPVGAAN